MQTFLPYPSFVESCGCLDRQRLGKQRVEAWQILLTLTDPTRKPWRSHPAVKMWAGYEYSLCGYGIRACMEWKDRGYNDNMLPQFIKWLQWEFIIHAGVLDLTKPPWLGREDFHASHRSNLLRKDPVWYGQFGWKESSDLPYIWPV